MLIIKKDDGVMESVQVPQQPFYGTVRKKMLAFSQPVTASLEDGKGKKPIYALDGVRGVACLSVVIFHVNMLAYYAHIWTPPFDNAGILLSAIAWMGDSGVKLFFILSGFLLFLPYARALLFDSDWPSFRRFYARRIFRILPGYYVAFFLIVLFMVPESFQPANWHNVWMFITFRNDFSESYQMPIPVFWTLAIEFQFYLLLPPIMWLIRPLVRRGALARRVLMLTLCLLGLLGWGLLTRYWGLFIADTPKLDYLLPHTTFVAIKPYIYGKAGKYFDVFAIGMLICMVYTYLHHAPSAEHLKTLVRRLSPPLFVVGLILLDLTGIWSFYAGFAHMSLHFLDRYQDFFINYKEMFMPICYGTGYGLCVFAVLHGPRGLKRPFEWAPLRQVGLISYSLYIWHYVFMLYFLWTFLPRFQILHWSPVVQYAIFWVWVLLTAFPLSAALYRQVELPAIRLGEQFCLRFAVPKQKTEPVSVSVNELWEEIATAIIPVPVTDARTNETVVPPPDHDLSSSTEAVSSLVTIPITLTTEVHPASDISV